LYQSVSISGPSATSNPIERKIASMRCHVRMIGWMPPRPRSRPGRVTSIASSARRDSTSRPERFAAVLQCRSIACLASLMRPRAAALRLRRA
jgi:hypothetical protein